MRIDKREDSFNFNFKGSYDVSAIADAISSWDTEWTVDQTRQQINLRPGETNVQNPQKDTYAYFIVNYRLQWQPNEVWRPVFFNKNMYKLILPIIEDLEQKHDGKIGRVFLAKLPANKEITPHADWQEYLMVCRRNHIAITTNPSVDFSVGDETIHMETGACWEINNSKVHRVVNNGDTDRVHLIIDIIPNELIPSE
jgi:hypothetical protein